MSCNDAECRFDSNITVHHLMDHVRNGIPTRVKYSDISVLPQRSDFLNGTMRSAIRTQISKRGPILFMPTSVHESPYFGRNHAHYIYLFGVTPCGSKTCIVLDGVEVHTDIRVPDDMNSGAFESVLREQFIHNNISFRGITDVFMYRLHGFQKTKSPFKRVTFRTLADRKCALDYIRNINKDHAAAGKSVWETAADDTGRGSYYFPKVAREYRFATADWNRIERYEVLSAATVTTNCAYALKVHVADFKKLSKDRRATYMRPGSGLKHVIDRDPTMVCMWDIETHRDVQNGLVPTPDDQDFTIFMICSAYFEQHSSTPMVTYCVCNQDTIARPGTAITVVCASEVDVLCAHMEIMRRMAPDVLGAFNGGNFDWPLYRVKLERNGLLTRLKASISSLPTYNETERKVKSYCFQSKEVKIDAETNHYVACVADFPGILDTDVLPVFLKMYPRAEIGKGASLNFFLGENGLESKEDMPYKRMFKIYERARAFAAAPVVACHCTMRDGCAMCREIVREIDCKMLPTHEYGDELHDDLCCYCGKLPRSRRDMADVGYYCVIDCVRPQQLYVKRMIMPDKRELSTMTYVSLFDSFWHADGRKVCNLIGAECAKMDIAFSNARLDKHDDEKDHYPGGWVFAPNRGLHSDGFIEVTIQDPDGTTRRVRVRCRPITGLDFNSLYPSLMMTYNFSPDMIILGGKEMALALMAEGYSVHHIAPFAYERGEEKGKAGNQQLIGEGWVVRHNGIHNPKKDTQVVIEYNKQVIDEYTVGGNVTAIEYTSAIGPSLEQLLMIQQLRDAGCSSTPKRTTKLIPSRGRNALPGERMGVFARVVKKLFDRRVPIKARSVFLSKLKEQMTKDKVDSTIIKQDGVDVVVHYNDVAFDRERVESKSRAVKVCTNTIYGMAGNGKSSVYSLFVAAGITTMGQENIKRVAAYVQSQGYIVHYGDTDSVYISCPDDMFRACDTAYEEALRALDAEMLDDEATYMARKVDIRRKWWTEQVTISMHAINTLREQVSDMLRINNGTTFLNVAYEEVGYPTVLCGKKKYYLKPHVAIVDFDSKELMIRGIDIIKQGQAPISRQLGYEFIRTSLSPANWYDLIDLAEHQIRKFYTIKHDVKLFTQSARYKPTKKNVPVLTFVKRMKDMCILFKDDPMLVALFSPPDAGDKFEYILVKKPIKYTLTGSRIDIKKGDQMEYVRVYLASLLTDEPMEIDLDYYMKNSIIGVFARMICYHERFQPPTGMYNTEDKEGYKSMDKHCVAAASKYLEAICDTITGYNKTAITQVGRNHRKIYHRANKQILNDIAARYGPVGRILHEINVHCNDKADEEAASAGIIHSNKAKRAKKDSNAGLIDRNRLIVDQFVMLAEGMYKGNPSIGPEFVKYATTVAGLSIFDVQKVFNGARSTSIARVRVEWCDHRMACIKDTMYQLAGKMSNIIATHEMNVITIIEDARTSKTIDDIIIDDADMERLNAFAASDIETIRQVYSTISQLGSVYRLKTDTLAIQRAIMDACNKIAGVTAVQPTVNIARAAQVESRNAAVLPDYEFQ